MDIRAVESSPTEIKRSRVRLLITSPYAVGVAASNLSHPTWMFKANHSFD
jgi:hypothetical protein